MASSSKSSTRTKTVCLICGAKGDFRLLIYCMRCHDSAIHQYCLGKYSSDDDAISWMCETCAPNLPMVVSSRKSERMNLKKDQVLASRLNWKKRLCKNGSTAKRSAAKKDGLFKEAQRANGFLPVEDMKSQFLSDNTCGKQSRGKWRRLILEDGNGSEEESELVKANISESIPGHFVTSNMSYCQPSLELYNHHHAQPIIDPIWRGSFSIASGKNETIFGLMAHISSKACSKVYDTAKTFPPVLNVEILLKNDIWPKSFQKLPPTDDSIALYFFPDSEMDEKVFDGLLDQINENLALKVQIGDAELLILSSLELPQQHWRFRRKHYLWGVFRVNQRSLTAY